MLRLILKFIGAWYMFEITWNSCWLSKKFRIILYRLLINGNKFQECLDITIGKDVEIDG